MKKYSLIGVVIMIKIFQFFLKEEENKDLFKKNEISFFLFFFH